MTKTEQACGGMMCYRCHKMFGYMDEIVWVDVAPAAAQTLQPRPTYPHHPGCAPSIFRQQLDTASDMLRDLTAANLERARDEANQRADSLAAENEAMRRALEKTAQRLNESTTGEMGLLETIHQSHGIVRTAIPTPAADHLKAHDAEVIERCATVSPNGLGITAADMPHQVWDKFKAAIRAMKAQP